MGEYKDSKKSGKGQFNWPNKSIFKGDFQLNYMHGNGTFTWSDGKSYNGNWKLNKMHGNGVFDYADGKVYEGEFKNDKREGFGLFIWLFTNQGKMGKSIKGNGRMVSSMERENFITLMRKYGTKAYGIKGKGLIGYHN